MHLNFEKWHGCQNDFLVFWVLEQDQIFSDGMQRITPRLCSRKGDGIGADGVIVAYLRNDRELTPSRVEIFNSDGSKAETCGNGLRCLAQSALKRARERQMLDLLGDGLVAPLQNHKALCRYLADPARLSAQEWPLIAVDMGPERFRSLNKDEQLSLETISGVNATAPLKPWVIDEAAFVDFANPHLCIYSEGFDARDIYRVGSALQKWEFCPGGINVHVGFQLEASNDVKSRFKRSVGANLEGFFEVFVWERGAGPTAACGSGACAFIAAAIEWGYCTSDKWHAVKMPGGFLFVRKDTATGSLLLAGPAEFVFQGTVEV